MTPIGAFAMAVLSVGASAFVYVLAANLETQPEYPGIATTAMRVVGGFVAAIGAVFGAVLLGYAVLAAVP